MADHMDAAPEHIAPEHTASEHSGDVNLTTVNPGSLPVDAAPVEKPVWATGDPFFDTMAGMDSSGYQQYLNQVSRKNIAPAANDHVESLVSTANSMALSEQIAVSDESSHQSTSTATDAASSSATYTNTGLEHWNRTREQWTKGRWHVVPSANSNNPALSAIHPRNHDAIYDSLVYDRKRLSKPIPLPLVIKVLVSGWKRDGLWQDSPAIPQVASSSALGSTPSSTPTQGGFRAYVPGFSSTNSQSLQRKL
ncbi:hypothetical protein BG011_006769 [Mortierella polycephala]|uniref:Gag1-like clamp domain-containing protein n=1 Tax=Mortierella polycephala TaxID=41804 RepID=A0A9P6QFK5_9FUNG|nr:hypothetical protein BG011_006769 [Mortierella polycephala]